MSWTNARDAANTSDAESHQRQSSNYGVSVTLWDEFTPERPGFDRTKG
ncbi:hypothetical protein [Caballeronia sp. GAFFF2]|nr:hypothetical protein [Caballeronia sp. GAFFF2]